LEKLEARLSAQGELNPITFMRDRSESLSQRSGELKQLADAWQPLYESLDADQKGRLRFLVVYVLNELREARESRMKDEDDKD
jgi:hypothetical protein